MAGIPPPTSTVRHGRRQACSGEPPSQLSLAVDACGWDECSGEDLTVEDLAIGEFLPVNAVPCIVSLTGGSLLTAGLGCLPISNLIFWIYFTDLNACFKNSYLKLGVSNFGEPNFVSFILKFSI